MFAITTNFTRADINQALRLARANYVDLVYKYVKPYGPTSNLCITQVETEVQVYLDDAFTGNSELRTGAVFAKDEASGEVIGFTIYLGGVIPPTDCGLNYIVVDQRHRLKGIMKAMLDVVMQKFTFIGLSCKVDKVPYYESLGFRITGHEMTQVGMSWGVVKPHGTMALLNFDHSVAIQAAKDAFRRTVGSRADSILAKLGQLQEEKTAEVVDYVLKRQSGLTHAEAL